MTKLALLALLGTATIAVEATPNLPLCEGGPWCGFDRPEDISPLPGTDWIVVTDQSKPIPLQLLATTNPVRRFSGTLSEQASLPTFHACDGPPEAMAVRGHTVRKHSDAFQLAVINTSRIELFDIVVTDDTASLTWSGCIGVPKQYRLNDLAFSAQGALFASHMFDLPTDQSSADALRNAFLNGTTTGYAVRWTQSTGWTKVAGTDLSFANGIGVSADQHTLAVAGTYSQKVTFVDLASGNTSERALPLQPDNITPLANGGFLVTGHTGTPVTGIDPCRSEDTLPCGFPFSVVKIHTDRSVEVILEQDGKDSPGASVAALADDYTILLGTAFGDRVTRLPISQIQKPQK